MPPITIQVLEGLERGRFYFGIQPPVSIGREEENTIRLNDERVSRFHAKLQEDGGRIILTDLDSTNGTRVNGRPVSMRVLKPGDQVAVGRCLLLFGSPEEIMARAEQSKREGQHLPHSASEEGAAGDEAFLLSSNPLEPVLALSPDLTAGQRVYLADLLGHIHDEIRRTLQVAHEAPTSGGGPTDMRVPGEGWQRLLQLEMDLAVALRQIADPESGVDAGPEVDTGMW